MRQTGTSAVLKARAIAAAKIPPSQLDETISVGLWNLREFGQVHRTALFEAARC